ncbi:hypothetical protein ACFLR7_02085 [Acidobacteriota bacterium]
MTVLLIICLLLVPFTSRAGHDAFDSDHARMIRSLKKLDDFPLYTMHFYGDYEPPNFAPQASLPQDMQCTCFSTKTEQGSQLLGRNFDKISVLPSTHAWQVATNFNLTGLSHENSRASCWRYQKV